MARQGNLFAAYSFSDFLGFFNWPTSWTCPICTICRDKVYSMYSSWKLCTRVHTVRHAMYVYIYILYKNHISTFIFPYQYLLIAFLVRPCQAKAGSSLWETQHFSSVFPGSPRCPCNFFMCFHAFSYNFHTRLVTSFNFPVHSWYILQI